MIRISYFFLLSTVDYTGSKSDSTPFRLEDVTLSCSRSVFVASATEAFFEARTFVALTFTTHKNGVR